jgi:hypothetical protein
MKEERVKRLIEEEIEKQRGETVEQQAKRWADEDRRAEAIVENSTNVLTEVLVKRGPGGCEKRRALETRPVRADRAWYLLGGGARLDWLFSVLDVFHLEVVHTYPYRSGSP